MSKELEITKKTKIDRVVAIALRTLYDDSNFNKLHKELMLAVFCQCLKEYDPKFSEVKFKMFIRGK